MRHREARMAHRLSLQPLCGTQCCWGRTPDGYQFLSTRAQYSSHALHMNIGLTCVQALFAGEEYRYQFPKGHGGPCQIFQGRYPKSNLLVFEMHRLEEYGNPIFSGLGQIWGTSDDANYDDHFRVISSRCHTMPYGMFRATVSEPVCGYPSYK